MSRLHFVSLDMTKEQSTLDMTIKPHDRDGEFVLMVRSCERAEHIPMLLRSEPHDLTVCYLLYSTISTL